MNMTLTPTIKSVPTGFIRLTLVPTGFIRLTLVPTGFIRLTLVPTGFIRLFFKRPINRIGTNKNRGEGLIRVKNTRRLP